MSLSQPNLYHCCQWESISKQQSHVSFFILCLLLCFSKILVLYQAQLQSSIQKPGRVNYIPLYQLVELSLFVHWYLIQQQKDKHNYKHSHILTTLGLAIFLFLKSARKTIYHTWTKTISSYNWLYLFNQHHYRICI